VKATPRRREAALRVFLERGCPEKGFGPSYLLGMIDEGAGNPQPEPEVIPLWKQRGHESAEGYDQHIAQLTEEHHREERARQQRVPEVMNR
jgi:hypothetical protein